ncbi:MAG: universal stress protein [Candidatus Sericytochromatia bacterium]|nr:universal stress protein [Candidatus Tanganyikabacteria bacterium]
MPEAALLEAAEEEGRGTLDEGVVIPREAAPAERPVLAGTLLHGDPGTVLLSWLERQRPDLAVLGTHGCGGLARLLLGSVADHLARHAPCPLLILPGKTEFEPETGAVSLLIDGVATGQHLREEADRLLRPGKHAREVAMALHPPPGPFPGQALGHPLVDWEAMAAVERAEALAQLEAVARPWGPGTATHLLLGSVPDVLSEHLRRTGPALAIVGTYGRKGLERILLGSVADHLIRHAPCPMLLIPVRAT